MRVSVLIPTLNRLRYLKEALEGARGQSHTDLEILVSDDGSTDGTREYVSALAEVDPRVRLLTGNPEPGIFTNMNHLVASATGDAFCLLGDDDRMLPDYVAKLVQELERHAGAVASFCDHWIIDADGRRDAEATDDSSLRYGRARLAGARVSDPVAIALDQTLCIGFALFRSRAFARRPFDIECGGAADVDFTITAASRGDFVYVAERLAEYRVHPGTATATKRLYMTSGLVRALLKHRFPNPAHERRRQALLRSCSRAHAFSACATDRRGALGSVARYLRLGGSPVDPRILAATTLALLPSSVAATVQRELRAWRQGATGRSA